MRKRIIALFLAVVMVCTLLPAAAFAMRTEIQITENPKDITVAKGEEFSLSCSATSNKNDGEYLYYMWIDPDIMPMDDILKLGTSCEKNGVIKASSLVWKFSDFKKIYDENPDMIYGAFEGDFSANQPSNTFTHQIDKTERFQCVVVNCNISETDVEKIYDLLLNLDYDNIQLTDLLGMTDLLGVEIYGYEFSDIVTVTVSDGHDCSKSETKLVNAKDATCTKAGYTGDKVCTVCGKTVEKGKTIAKLGHSYTEKVVKPTASKQGYTQHTCSVCGDSYKDNYTVAAPTVTLSNVASSGKIKLSWSKITGAEKYYVYRATSKTGTYSRIATVTDLSYTDSKATAAKTYYYKVKAVKSNGTTSAYSSAKYLTCDLARPTVTLSNVASSGKIKLSWSKITGAEKYYIYRSTDGETYSYVTSTTSTSYTDSKATAKKKYYYRVKAVCSVSAATSAQSTAKSLTCDLARPTVKITTSNGDPKLTWAKVTGATKYEVYRATSKSGTYSKMITTTKTSYTNTSAKAGKTYYYKVKAVCGTSAAASAYSTVVSIKAK